MFSVVLNVYFANGFYSGSVDHTDGCVHEFSVSVDSLYGCIITDACPEEIYMGYDCVNVTFEPGFAEMLIASE